MHAGVIKIPKRLEILALKIPAGMFPCAIEIITIDEDTVDGNAAKKNKLNQRLLFTTNGFRISTSNGNNINVAH